MKPTNYDLFGNAIVEDVILREQFLEPPFSILDTKTGSWQRRKRQWIDKGIKSEVGRSVSVINMDTQKKENNSTKYTSIFDPSLCEVLYRWFCPDGGTILDPFAGGSVRGIVANYLGYNYTGIEIRPEQVESNYIQAREIIPHHQPNWICGDSLKELDLLSEKYDFVFSCPPYGDLEVYSDLDGDISNMSYQDFLAAYEEIILKSVNRLNDGGMAVFVVGEFRDKNGNYVGFVPDTIKAFEKAGAHYYNEAILLNPVASASMRANGNMKTKKLVKIHQNILIFKK